MDLKSKSDLVRSLIGDLKLPKGFSLTEVTVSVGKDAIGSPEHVHTFEHGMNGEKLQTFHVYISDDSITLQYEYSTSCFHPYTGDDHIEKAFEDVRKYIKKGCTFGKANRSERRKLHRENAAMHGTIHFQPC